MVHAIHQTYLYISQTLEPKLNPIPAAPTLFYWASKKKMFYMN